MNAIGATLRNRRVALGLSQEALAEKAGVSARSVNRWEQGRALPQHEVCRRLAEILQIDLGELVATARFGRGPGSQQLPSVWHVPLRRNLFFTGRDALLEDLHAALQPTDSALRIQALTGLAGIGKTQTALEYACRFAQAYQAVFWVSADTQAGAIAGFCELASVLALPVRSDAHFGHTLAALREWLRQHPDWLVILDNLDDPRVLDDMALVGRGAILITTRAHAIGAVGGCLEVPPMAEAEGAAFVLRRSKILRPGREVLPADDAAALALSSRLGGLPLALDQAAAYLEETGCGLDVYLERLRTQQQALLGRRGRLARDHMDSVDATLSLAYRRIAHLNPAASDLLCLCAFLHPDFIPDEVLAAAVTDSLQLDDALADLATLSFVRHDPHSHGITIHRLVQDVVRSRLTELEHRDWAERAVSAIAQALPGSEPFHFSRFLRFVPQAGYAVELVTRWQIGTAEAARLLDRLGAHHQLTGNYAASLRLLKHAWRLRKQCLGRDHLETAETLLHLAELSLVSGLYHRSETLARTALQLRQAQLAPTHLLVAEARGFLARVRTERGGYDEADGLARQALEAQVHLLTAAHPQIAETLSLLAEVAFMRGRYDETERLLRQALEINEVGLGTEHLVTGLTRDALGTLYRYSNRDLEAATELSRALAILSAALGSDHPTVMTVLNGLARAKLSLGETLEAEALARRALSVRETVLGADHPKLAYSLQVLSEILLAQGRFDEAESLARRGLAIRNRIHGEQHPTVSISLDILAQVRQRQGDSREADTLYRRALAILENTVGPDHPRVAETRKHYSALHDGMQHTADDLSAPVANGVRRVRTRTVR
jgi:tetratricopeptide (TPR) repeat protein/DNA-binding XRE family transcriptional regulator